MSSYLATELALPLPRAAIERALGGPVGLMSAGLRADLDDVCRHLRFPAADALQFHGDESWLDAHVEWLAARSGWEYLTLLDAASGPALRREAMPPSGWVRSARQIPYLAFAYADAALAERLARLLPEGEAALYEISPSGGESVALLLAPDGHRRLPGGFISEWHPLRQWLCRMHHADDAALPWAALAERRAGGAPLDTQPASAWRAFVQRQQNLAVARAAATMPVRLSAFHFTDGSRVWLQPGGGEAPTLLEGAHPIGFRAAADSNGFPSYGVDARGLWHRAERLPCDDTAAFAPLAVDSRFMTDGRHVYRGHETLAGIDAREARAVPGDAWQSGFLHRDQFVTAYADATIHAVDGATLRGIGQRFFAERGGVHELHQGELVLQRGLDPETTRLVAHFRDNYLADARRVAYARGHGRVLRMIKGVDAAAFRGVPLLPFATDGRSVWQQDRRCDSLDAATLRAAPRSAQAYAPSLQDPTQPLDHAISRSEILHVDGVSFRVLPGADASTFELLGQSAARDANGVWWGGTRVDGANGAGFVWIDAPRCRWTDGDRVFLYEAPLRPARAAAQVVDVPTSYCQIEVTGDECRFEGAVIEGWSPAMHRVGPAGFIEDAQWCYTLSSNEGGSVLAWPKRYADLPAFRYELDRIGKVWRRR